MVEVTSEEKEYPVEAALVAGEMRGWRAAESGTQAIRLLFDKPQRLARISVVFEETETQRTQEFVLRWSPDVVIIVVFFFAVVFLFFVFGLIAEGHRHLPAHWFGWNPHACICASRPAPEGSPAHPQPS